MSLSYEDLQRRLEERDAEIEKIEGEKERLEEESAKATADQIDSIKKEMQPKMNAFNELREKSKKLDLIDKGRLWLRGRPLKAMEKRIQKLKDKNQAALDVKIASLNQELKAIDKKYEKDVAELKKLEKLTQINSAGLSKVVEDFSKELTRELITESYFATLRNTWRALSQATQQTIEHNDPKALSELNEAFTELGKTIRSLIYYLPNQIEDGEMLVKLAKTKSDKERNKTLIAGKMKKLEILEEISTEFGKLQRDVMQLKASSKLEKSQRDVSIPVKASSSDENLQRDDSKPVQVPASQLDQPQQVFKDVQVSASPPEETNDKSKEPENRVQMTELQDATKAREKGEVARKIREYEERLKEQNKPGPSKNRKQ